MQEAALSPDCITELRENKEKVQDLAPINTGLLAQRTPVSRSTEGTEPKFCDASYPKYGLSIQFRYGPLGLDFSF
jgi:hypothetical protein